MKKNSHLFDMAVRSFGVNRKEIGRRQNDTFGAIACSRIRPHKAVFATASPIDLACTGAAPPVVE
jgi:hypothetical protein